MDWGTLLGWIGFFAFIAGLTAWSAWAQRRRRRGDEGTGYNAEGADAGVVIPPGMGG